MAKESLVNSEQARHAMGRKVPCSCGAKPDCEKCNGTGLELKPLSRSYLWALKKAAGKESGQPIGRLFYVSQLQSYLKKHPDFNSKSVAGDDDALLADVLAFLKNPLPLAARAEKRQELIVRLEAEVA